MNLCRRSADGLAMEVVGDLGVWIEPVRTARVGVENRLGQARKFVEEPVVPLFGYGVRLGERQVAG